MPKVYPNDIVVAPPPLQALKHKHISMPKVYPKEIVVALPPPQALKPTSDAQQVLTVWKKSLLFNCRGFTVLDAKGKLVFRVDNYFSSNKSQVLMDGAGVPLLTLRGKKLTISDNWTVYNGETDVTQLYKVKKNVSFLNSKLLAHVTSGFSENTKPVLYRIEGSYGRRSCAVYDERRKVVAEIKRKESAGGVSLGRDVFQLVVQPEMDLTVAMALVILLEQMFGAK